MSHHYTFTASNWTFPTGCLSGFLSILNACGRHQDCSYRLNTGKPPFPPSVILAWLWRLARPVRCEQKHLDRFWVDSFKRSHVTESPRYVPFITLSCNTATIKRNTGGDVGTMCLRPWDITRKNVMLTSTGHVLWARNNLVLRYWDFQVATTAQPRVWPSLADTCLYPYFLK